MKAVCFFGLIRSFAKNINGIIKNIIEPNNPDIFICTSIYDNHKTRFKVDHEQNLNIDDITNILSNAFGQKLKGLYIYDNNSDNVNIKDARFKKIAKVLELKKAYETTNNFIYDTVAIHRLDVIFCPWDICDKYYDDRVVEEEREKGLVKINNTPIGVKNHGCCSIQICPNIDEISTIINLPENMNDNTIGCYEDYWIGHVLIDFAYGNSRVMDIYGLFYEKCIKNNNLIINPQFKKNKTTSLQSYEGYSDWYNYSKQTSAETQLKLYLMQNNIINYIQLRRMIDIGVLYIR